MRVTNGKQYQCTDCGTTALFPFNQCNCPEEKQLAEYCRDNMRLPTLSQICKAFGYKSKATASKKLKKLKLI